MSILIKGLKMPKKGTCIDIVILADGTVVCYDDDDKKIGEAVELPDHGDLIDRDKLVKHGVYLPQDGGALPIVYMSYVKGATAVIPAERNEDEAN